MTNQCTNCGRFVAPDTRHQCEPAFDCRMDFEADWESSLVFAPTCEAALQAFAFEKDCAEGMQLFADGEAHTITMTNRTTGETKLFEVIREFEPTYHGVEITTEEGIAA